MCVDLVRVGATSRVGSRGRGGVRFGGESSYLRERFVFLQVWQVNRLPKWLFMNTYLFGPVDVFPYGVKAALVVSTGSLI